MHARLATLLAAALLLAGCTNGRSDDADRDGLTQAEEEKGRIITITRLSGEEQRAVTSDPDKADTDGDGLDDNNELFVKNTDPRSVDTDGDRLLDGDDVDPDEETAAAWRALGILEANGTFLGEEGVCKDGVPLSATRESSDSPRPDGLGDGEEIRGWDILLRGNTRRVSSDPCVADTDNDGLTDELERELMTDPRLLDTDADGTRDGADADPSSNLGLLLSNLTVVTNRSAVRVTFAVGLATTWLTWPGNGSVTLAVSDESSSRDTLRIDVLITAEDLATGERVAIFPDERGSIVSFDLVQGSVAGLETDGQVIRAAGADGSVTFRWETARQ